MKKLIVILTIATVLISTAFAVDGEKESHLIKLRTNVQSESPVFEFVFKSGMMVDEETGIANSVVLDKSEYNSNQTAIEVADISKEDLELVFVLNLHNKAKSTKSYTFTLNDGVFKDVTRNGERVDFGPSERMVIVSEKIADCRGVSVKEAPIYTNSIEFKFTGEDCEEGELATFVVKYQADSKLDPATDGYYYARFALVVESK